MKNWEFFEERYATKQDWLAWFHKSKVNTIDHRSYAEVVCTKNIGVPIPPSIEKCARFQSISQSSAKYNQNGFSKTDILERHKHQSPVQHQNLVLSKVTARNTTISLPYLNTEFELDLNNRFAPLQDMGLELSEAEHTTDQPSMATHSNLSNIPRVPQKKLCKKNDLLNTCNDNLSILCEPSHQALNNDHIIPLELNKEKFHLRF